MSREVAGAERASRGCGFSRCVRALLARPADLHALFLGGTEQWRQRGVQLRSVNILDAHDAYAALLQLRHKVRDRGLAELDGGEVEHDGRSDEKISRVFYLLLDLRDPFDEWGLRCKRDSHV